MNSLVAVAVIVWPTATLPNGENVKEARPFPATVRPVFWPRKVLPSSVLPGGLEKNCTV